MNTPTSRSVEDPGGAAGLPLFDQVEDEIKMLPLTLVSEIHDDHSTEALQKQTEARQKQKGPVGRKSHGRKSSLWDGKTRGGEGGRGGTVETEDITAVEGHIMTQNNLAAVGKRGTRKSIPLSSKNVDVANIRFSDDAMLVRIMRLRMMRSMYSTLLCFFSIDSFM